MLKKRLVVIIILLALGAQLPAMPVFAQFNPNFILSDAELTNSRSMDFGQIQDFLEKKGSGLASYVDPLTKISATQSIYHSALFNQISPKYLLVLLQKEQSLIVNSTPSQGQLDWATGYGICDSCSKSDPKVQKYKGFANQVEWAAGGTRFYLDNPAKFKFQVGGTYTISDKSGESLAVTIANDATRALYTYTPHIHGNRNFHAIWSDWFTSSYLDGMLLQDAEAGGIYLIRDGQKHPFLSKASFLSRYSSFDKVVTVNPAELAKYPTGNAIKYPNYSLLQIPSGGIYLLDDDTLRPIDSKETFRLLGFNPEEVVAIESGDLFAYKFGQPITEKSAYPTGGLLQDKTTGGVYFVEYGIKHPIPSRKILKLYYAHKKISPVSPAELEKYETGAVITVRDGELVRAESDPTVYFISNGAKRPFASQSVFLSMGYKFENVITVEDHVLKLHSAGDPITNNS